MSERKEIRISTSLINQMFPDGEEKSLCPRQLKTGYIDRKYRMPETEAMSAGRFFEYLCLGSGANPDDNVTDLRSVKSGKGGEKSVDQVRIEDQVRQFETLVEQLGCKITPENTQQHVGREWEHDYNEWSDDYEVLITGVLDFISPVNAIGFKENGERYPLIFDEAVIDLKLTKDIWGTFGRNRSWAYPWTMSHTQLAIYNYITGLPAMYWVFDYKTKPEFRLYYKELTSIEQLEMHETIRKTVEAYISMNKLGWPASPAFYRCRQCPFKEEDCADRTKRPDIQIF